MGKLFAGLERFGLNNMKDMEVFHEETKKEEEKKQPEVKNEITEADLLFEKTYTCPVCDTTFKAKTIRTGKAKLLSADTDLRPRYQGVDCLKYDAIVCTKCGFAALGRFFSSKYITPVQAKFIKEQVSSSFRGLPEEGEILTYDDAIMRHKLALANTVVKKAKISERAYTCLKLAWVLRGKAESLSKDDPNYAAQVKELKEEEDECILNAYEGFQQAFSKETFPMCGMDEITTTYLEAELARRCRRFDEAGRWIAQILTSRQANERIKNKAREIKELINEDKERLGIK